MRVTVNGIERDVRDGATIADLLALLGVAPDGIAVACNDRVVRRALYGEHRVGQGDRVEIIKAVAGG